MSHASDFLDRIIAADLARQEARDRFERGCRGLVEQTFLTDAARHFGCDYAAVEVAFDSLGLNVADLVNSPNGRVVLGMVLSVPGTAPIPTSIN